MRRVVGVVIVALLATAGCIRDNTVECGDLRCPVDAVCTPGGGCATQDQISACVGLVDAADCMTREFAVGICVSSVCEPVECGDAVVRGPEVCDDGNQRSGDGCSADCASLEVCGNGYVDPLADEQCDNVVAGLSNDGCTSTCTTEVPAWTDVTPPVLAGRYEQAMAYDARRNRVVMFGGTNQAGTSFRATWELDGRLWRKLRPPTEPTISERPGMAFDRARGRILLFGSNTNQYDVGETWSYDGIDWTKVTSPISPHGRVDHSMAYDEARNQVVMFGGNSNLGPMVDTWVWDGTNWTERAAAGPVGGRATMAWDPARQRIVLVDNAGTTWSWSGTAWESVGAVTLSTGGKLVRFTNRVIYVSAESGSFELVGSVWAPQSNVPSSRFYPGLAFDELRGRAVMFGGAYLGSDIAETWQFDGTWSLIPVQLSPGMRSLVGAAYVARRGRTVLFGGETYLYPRGDMFEWDGYAWIELAPGANPPPNRYSHAMTAVGDGVLLFGGLGVTAVLGDTWTWDGTTWTQHAPPSSPPARFEAAIAYDHHRGRAILFGGAPVPSSVLDDTWEWDGTTWLMASPAHHPPGRSRGRMAYDAQRRRVVMFGGVAATNGAPFADTWEWDGTDWVDRTPAAGSPSPRSAVGLAYDPARRRTMLFGGGAVLDDSWEWDGTAWRKLSVAEAPPGRAGHLYVYDPIHGGMFTFAGTGVGTTRSDIWLHQFASVSAPRDHCIEVDTDGDGLAGCADPDCWARCTPLCPPGEICDPAAPRCGDGTCSMLEDARLCPTDCPP